MTRAGDFDHAIRVITMGVIALACVISVIYEQVMTGHVDPNLQGWGSLIIGFYFGHHRATMTKMGR